MIDIRRVLDSFQPPGLERLEAAFRHRAEAEGLVDVAYGTVDSPLGDLLVASTERGLVRLAYPDEGIDPVLKEMAEEISPRIMESPRATDPIRRQLDEYFEGRRNHFEFQIDWSLTKGFGRRVLQATASIPFGSVDTYKGVAERVGSPRSARAVGNALGSNPIPVVVPCHRVVRTGGNLGGYTGGLAKKVFLLELEGAS